jgi:transcriptional regulator with XRE-family HTH domain
MINNLKKIRLEKNITQVRLCNEAQLSSPQQVYKTEQGMHAPRIDTALRIAKVLGVDVNKIWKL